MFHPGLIFVQVKAFLIMMMEEILQNPGLQHIAEEIFWKLSYEDLENCRLVNQSCKQILENPMFWLKWTILHYKSI